MKARAPLCTSPLGPVAQRGARCDALIRTDTAPLTTADGTWGPDGQTGYGPADLQSAYDLPSGLGAGQTVAIVDAYYDPTIGADLSTYRSYYGLPACTTANGCFTVYSQTADSGLPPDPATTAPPAWAHPTTSGPSAASAPPTC